MIYGTAGFTAAQCVAAIVDRGIKPERGPVVVTGATGGVGSLQCRDPRETWLRRRSRDGQDKSITIGCESSARRKLLGRDDVTDESDRPLLAARWAAGVDTVGGNPLATLLRSVDHRGCVAACGLVAGINFNTSVYPVHSARAHAGGD